MFLTGKQCQIFAACVNNPCQNNGECFRDEVTGEAGCECWNPYTGPRCEVEQQCFNQPCLNEGECFEVNLTLQDTRRQSNILKNITSWTALVWYSTCSDWPLKFKQVYGQIRYLLWFSWQIDDLFFRWLRGSGATACLPTLGPGARRTSHVFPHPVWTAGRA